MQYVYVLSKQTFLRDRVAAVSNRVANVVNGERLEVLEEGHRWLRVKTDKGETGWIEDRAVVKQDVVDQFQAMQQQHAQDATVATAVLRDEVPMHVKPGRDTDRFYILPEADKLQLLARASTPKPMPPQALPAARSAPTTTKPAHLTGANKTTGKAKKHSGVAEVPMSPTVPMEDWWLVRDLNNHIGWVLGRRFDVDVPDSVAGYAEGQRIVGAYVLTTVNDPGADVPDKNIPIYLTLLNAYKDGLPYDFNAVRVFTWNTKKHRYETAYRERDLLGYLPVTLSKEDFSKQDLNKQGGSPELEPTFTIHVAERASKSAASSTSGSSPDPGPVSSGAADASGTAAAPASPDDDIAIDPATGIARPAHLIDRQYRLEGVSVKRVLAPGEASSARPGRSSATAKHSGVRNASSAQSTKKATGRKHH